MEVGHFAVDPSVLAAFHDGRRFLQHDRRAHGPDGRVAAPEWPEDRAVRGERRGGAGRREFGADFVREGLKPEGVEEEKNFIAGVIGAAAGVGDLVMECEDSRCFGVSHSLIVGDEDGI